jgi:hypothetical protein
MREHDARAVDRRTFLQATGTVGAVALASGAALAGEARREAKNAASFAGGIGIVSASAQAQLTKRAKNGTFSLLELPRVMRDDLDLTVIDLNTMSFPNFRSVDRSYLDKLRSAAADAGCVLTNLKLNQPGLDMNSPQEDVRQKALVEYKRSIDIASQLGCRWARPLPASHKPDLKIHISSYRELCDYAAEREVQMLVENYGWMQADPDSVVDLVKAIGHNVAAGPDVGNWNGNEIRYKGLAKTLPLAVTCDFKALKLDPQGQHPAYDLKRCFDIAWAAGFRGPWCIEHANADTPTFFKEIGLVRDMLRSWTKLAKLEESGESPAA